MPNEQRHRGAHPLDARLFAASQLPMLREAVRDFSWLLERGYATKSGLELVGNHFQLHERQRLAVMRSSCGESARARRRARCVGLDALRGQTLHLDGYNVLTIVESALAGGAILCGRDGCLRDIASLHGTFRRVEETEPALELIGQFLNTFGASRVVWWLDSPVSNSGRLAGLMREVAARRAWDWDAKLVFNADAALVKETGGELIATADSVILDAELPWLNLGRQLIEREVPNAWRVDLGEEETA